MRLTYGQQTCSTTVAGLANGMCQDYKGLICYGNGTCLLVHLSCSFVFFNIKLSLTVVFHSRCPHTQYWHPVALICSKYTYSKLNNRIVLTVLTSKAQKLPHGSACTFDAMCKDYAYLYCYLNTCV